MFCCFVFCFLFLFYFLFFKYFYIFYIYLLLLCVCVLWFFLCSVSLLLLSDFLSNLLYNIMYYKCDCSYVLCSILCLRATSGGQLNANRII